MKFINQLFIYQLLMIKKKNLNIHVIYIYLIDDYFFTLFESEEMKHFCNDMNSEYKSSIRSRIIKNLFNKIYHDI